MRLRPTAVVALALAVLLSRTIGQHFHVAEQHHDAVAASVHASERPHGPESFPGHEVEHLLEHLAGAQDVDASALPSADGFKATPVAVALAFIGVALPPAGFVATLESPQAPFRPPRLQRRAELLPPSQGPPPAA